jgi:hypothetical protein
MSEEEVKIPTLIAYQVKLLLEDIESSDQPQQNLCFRSFCNSNERIYGVSGSPVSKLEQNVTDSALTTSVMLTKPIFLLSAQTSIPIQVCKDKK